MAADINTISPATNPFRLSNTRQQVSDQQRPTAAGKPQAASSQISEAQLAAAAPEKAVEVNPARIESAVKDIEQFVQSSRRELRFSVDNDLGRTVVTILDSNDEVIRKIPSEEVLTIARQIKEASSDNDISLFSTKI